MGQASISREGGTGVPILGLGWIRLSPRSPTRLRDKNRPLCTRLGRLFLYLIRIAIVDRRVVGSAASLSKSDSLQPALRAARIRLWKRPTNSPVYPTSRWVLIFSSAWHYESCPISVSSHHRWYSTIESRYRSLCGHDYHCQYVCALSRALDVATVDSGRARTARGAVRQNVFSRGARRALLDHDTGLYCSDELACRSGLDSIGTLVLGRVFQTQCALSSGGLRDEFQ